MRSVQNWKGYLNKISRLYYAPAADTEVKPVYNITLSAWSQAQLKQYGDHVLTDIFAYILDTTRRFVTTDADIDAEFPEFTAALEEMGLNTVLQVYTEEYANR